MEFKVCGLDTLDRDIQLFQPTHVLTVIEKDEVPALRNAWSVVDHKIVTFRDIDDDSNPTAPTLEDCMEIVNWGRTLPRDAKVLVHCMAGISRSTCATLALMYDEYICYANTIVDNSDKEVILGLITDKIVNIRKIAFPNLLMAKYFDQCFDLKGRFVETVKNIRGSSTFLLQLRN